MKKKIENNLERVSSRENKNEKQKSARPRRIYIC